MKLTVDTIIANVYTDEDGYSDAYGYRVFDSHPLASLTDDGLFLGKYDITDYDLIVFKSKIPCLYVIWEDNSTRSFVCGLDLMDDGRVWVGIGRDSYFNTVEEAMEFVEKHEGVSCHIRIEEEMHI